MCVDSLLVASQSRHQSASHPAASPSLAMNPQPPSIPASRIVSDGHLSIGLSAMLNRSFGQDSPLSDLRMVRDPRAGKSLHVMDSARLASTQATRIVCVLLTLCNVCIPIAL